MFHQFILDALSSVNPERLQRAVCGLADGTYHVYLTERSSSRVAGSIINGDGREYAVSIGDGYLSCECADFTYRKSTVCKHLLACGLRILQSEEPEPVDEEPEARSVNLKMRKFRTSDELASDRAPRRLPALPYDELPR